MTMSGEIFVVTSVGSGHLFPCIELSSHLSSRNYTTTLVLPSNLLPSLPPSFLHNPLLRTAPISPFRHFGPPNPAQDKARHQAGLDLSAHLEAHRPLCAVVDIQVGWTKPLFDKFNVPVVSFFTFGACAAAMEWGAWRAGAGNLNPGEVRMIPGLTKEMYVTYPDCNRQRDGGPKAGDQPPWVPEIEGSIGLLFNTCEGIEGPFLSYLADQIGVPVWGVGPLLPKQYWETQSGSLIPDSAIRNGNAKSSCTEEEVIQWLDSKPRRSVLYVSFGSEMGPTMEEYPKLASALEDSAHPFIWVIQLGSGLRGGGPPGELGPPVEGGSDGEGLGYFPHDLTTKVGDRGLIIRGWAPQLLILSHPSTGGFVSHCGWNSTVEAVGRGVPVLAWPMRGDQIFNAKLVVNHLDVGWMALGDDSLDVDKKDLVEGIDRLMGDPEIPRRAGQIQATIFQYGFPSSSEVALDTFRDFINEKAAKFNF